MLGKNVRLLSSVWMPFDIENGDTWPLKDLRILICVRSPVVKEFCMYAVLKGRSNFIPLLYPTKRIPLATIKKWRYAKVGAIYEGW